MSATVVVRRVVATPGRSAAQAWTVIADLVAPPGSAARQEFDRVAGVAMSLVAAEAMRDSAIILHGVGPRLRLYCLYDDEAVLGEGASEEPLAWRPTDGDWAMSLPCPTEDLAWVRAALARVSARVTARPQSEQAPDETQATASLANGRLGPVDVEAFFRP
jgi:hypothetical protein